MVAGVPECNGNFSASETEDNSVALTAAVACTHCSGLIALPLCADSLLKVFRLSSGAPVECLFKYSMVVKSKNL